MRINEIFYSLQGEGHFTGTPAIFVRFSGCNLSCPFCDTDHLPAVEMTEEQIMERVKAYPASLVIITGGEPSLQLTETLVDRLHQAGKSVHIETNGSLPLSPRLIEALDWITVSPKSGVIPAIQRVDELKVVFDMNHPEHIAALDAVTTREPGTYYLQPCHLSGNEPYNAENLRACISYIMEHPKWRLSLQTHKILNIR